MTVPESEGGIDVAPLSVGGIMASPVGIAPASAAPASSMVAMGVRSLEQIRDPLACGTQTRFGAQSVAAEQASP